MKPLQCLNGKKVILASGSPRRRELLTKLGIEFECIPSRFPETLDKSQFQTPCDYVIENARQKGLEVVDRIKSEGGRELPDLVISADTVVVTLDGQILEKPSNHQDAYQMLKSLCGIKHSVVSGVVLFQPSMGKEFSFTSTSSVYFGKNVTDELIRWYISTGEPFDKAGSYGYQSLGMVLVERIDGCFYNVMGFPVYQFVQEVSRLFP